MTFDQGLLFALFAAILAMLVWGRVRHDLVAAGALVLAVALGLVPANQAFSGFSNDAVIIVALVLVVSRAFENSGALSVLTRKLADKRRSIGTHIALTSGLGAALSAVINNVAALALLMPLDVETARQAGRPAGPTLMPLSFATILGGLVTLIGTPPNIIASSIRSEYLGRPYQMFDFTPVGFAIAAAGIAYIALVGWRLVPRREDKARPLVNESAFKAELRVPGDSPVVGQYLGDLDEESERADVLLLGLIRDGRPYYRRASAMRIADEDTLIVEGSRDAIASFVKATRLHETPPEKAEARKASTKDSSDQAAGEEEQPKGSDLVEGVVRSDSRLIGTSARAFGLRRRFRVTLLGVAHAGELARTQVRDHVIAAGDVVLLTGYGVATLVTLDNLGVIAINRTSAAPFRPRDAALAVGFFGLAIVLASTGLLAFDVALALAVAAYAAFGIVPAREFYQQIEWPIVVMLACLLPIGAAFDTVGGTKLIAEGIAGLAAGHAPAVALVAVMVATMLLSGVLNNVATIIIFGPVAIDLATRLGVNPDTFLMGVAVASSCAFLSPIGHKNNMLIMGPGGFRFADYWRAGMPLALVVLAVGVPVLLMVWPL